uniref:NADAR domain-containing protein n=1 Tax=Plectus sambesii TaxID=2011161 RepID=A0A914XL77_9BILA
MASKYSNRKRKSEKTEEVEDGLVTGVSPDGSESFTLFYGHVPVFSNFHPSPFTVDGVSFSCGEQFFHHAKAVHFKDDEHAAMILATDEPRLHKQLGRKVEHFVPQEWNDVCLDVMKRGSFAKYEQNDDMRKQLFATAGTTLVEASPRDRKWGIGLGVHNPKALDRKSWRGENCLGKLLTEVRDDLMKRDIYRKEIVGSQ